MAVMCHINAENAAGPIWLLQSPQHTVFTEFPHFGQQPISRCVRLGNAMVLAPQNARRNIGTHWLKSRTGLLRRPS